MIPDFNKEKSQPKPPEFVRNVVGSSAGAGSGEFHIYRHGRRKEYARIAQMENDAKKVLRFSLPVFLTFRNVLFYF